MCDCFCGTFADISLWPAEMTDSQLLSQTIFSATNVLFYDIKKVMFLFIFRTLLAPVLTGSVRYTDELILWAFNSGPHSTDMRQVVQSSWVESCTPVCIGHRGEWSEERAVDDRCVLHPACLSRFRTTVMTVAFANEEHTGDVENAWAVMGWSVRVRGMRRCRQHPPNISFLFRKWSDCKGF